MSTMPKGMHCEGYAMTETELFDYFNEHVYFELQTLTFTKQRLEQETEQLSWNAMFAAFNVSARNLYDFLNNKGTRNEVRVDDYKNIRTNTQRDSVSEIQGLLNALHAQCFHMGKSRVEKANKKVNLDKIRKFSIWVISNMDALIKSFKDEFASKLRPEWGALTAPGPKGLPPSWSIDTTSTFTMYPSVTGTERPGKAPAKGGAP
jgi:hypothetical protein